MKRSFSFDEVRVPGLVAAGTGLIAATYGLVRLAYGLFLPDVQGELQFDAATAGLISAGASAIYCVGAIVGFFFAAGHPRRLVIAAALAAGLGAAGMASATQTLAFALCAILSSAGAGLASPALVSIIGRNVGKTATQRSQAIVNAGTGPGLVAAGILALMLLPDWRLAWFAVAGFTLVIAAAVLVLDRNSRPTGSAAPGLPPPSWFRRHEILIMAALLMGAGSAAVWNFGRTHLVAAGATADVSASAWIALGLGGAAAIGSARALSAVTPRTAWTVTTLTMAVAGAALGINPSNVVAAFAACAAFGWGYTAATNALIAWTTQIDAGRAAAGTSLLFVILILGQAIGALAVGALVSSAGYLLAFLVAAGATAVAAAIPLLRHRGRTQRLLSDNGTSGSADAGPELSPQSNGSIPTV